MLKSLEQWICDRCGQVIEEPNQGSVEWIDDSKTHKASGFKIVHQSSYAPHDNGECYHYSDHPGRLEEFIGQNGMVMLLSFLDIGPYLEADYQGPRVKDMREFVEFTRRLTVPYYEEARLYWNQAEQDGLFDGANEISLYLPRTLEQIVRDYGEST
jgi:NAD-dependent dihydropyrimidine dehydrogenase PreA subunit